MLIIMRVMHLVCLMDHDIAWKMLGLSTRKHVARSYTMMP